jgi:hypothetical protein
MKRIVVDGNKTGYFIDKEGSIYSEKSHKFLKPNEIKGGYHQVCLMINGKGCRYLVHRLVALVYIKNPNNLPHVNHIDNNRSNNSVTNLEWVTVQQNSNHKLLHNRQHRAQGILSGMAKLTEYIIKSIRFQYENGVSRSELSKMYKISYTQVDNIVKRKQWRHI